MNQSPETDLFEIPLSNEGTGYLLRLYKLNRWLFVTCSTAGALLLINTVIRNRIYMRYDTGKNWILFVLARVYPGYVVVAVLLTVFQCYCYNIFSRICKKSIEEQRADMFNASFKWLVWNTRAALFVFLLQIALTIFFIYSDYLWLGKIR